MQRAANKMGGGWFTFGLKAIWWLHQGLNFDINSYFVEKAKLWNPSCTSFQGGCLTFALVGSQFWKQVVKIKLKIESSFKETFPPTKQPTDVVLVGMAWESWVCSISVSPPHPHHYNHPVLHEHLLSLIDGLGHGEEGAVGEDGEHHQVVEVLVHR